MLKKEIKIIIGILFFIVLHSQSLKANTIGIFCTRTCLNFVNNCSIDDYSTKKIEGENLCDTDKLVVFGPEAITKYLKHRCKKQKVIYSGLLYPNIFFPQELPGPFLSPLPGYSILEKYGQKFVIIYSEPLNYYVKYLKKHLIIKAYKIKSIWNLEKSLQKALENKNYTLLLLPDPILIDKRGEKILDIILEEKKGIKIINLLGRRKRKEYRQETILDIPEKALCYTLIKLFQKTDLKKKIYFPENPTTQKID